MNYNGVISICGLVSSPDLPTSVFPFILRGVSMFGIDSSETDIVWRENVWQKISNDWKPTSAALQSISKVVFVDELSTEIEKILQGNQMGRVIIKHPSKKHA